MRSMKKQIVFFAIAALIAACQPPATATVPSDTATPGQPTFTAPPDTATPPPTFTPALTNTPLPTPLPDCGQNILEPKEVIHAVHMTGNYGANFEPENTLPAEYFEYLRDLNVNWVGISVALHYEDSMDSTVERKYSGVQIPTFTDEFLRKMIRAFHQYGICVYMTLAFEAFEAYEAAHPAHRGILGEPELLWEDPNIQPEFWPWAIEHPDHERFVAEFWQTYTEQAVHFAQLAEEEGIALYSLGTETEGLFRTRPSRYWTNDFREELRAMVAAVREVYSGALTYDQIYHVFTIPALDYKSGSEHLWEDLGLDVIGISAYFELSDDPPAAVLSVESLEERWEEIVQEHLIPLQASNPGKPIYFTEFGYVDSLGAPYVAKSDEFTCRAFSDQDGNGLDDGEEMQANIYQAFFNVMDRHPGVVNGAFLWGMMMADDDRWANSFADLRGFDFRDKLAEDVARAYYGAEPRADRNPLALYGSPIISSPESEAALIIFDDSPNPKWNITSWNGEFDLAAESVVHNGQRAIAATLDPWGNVGLESGSLDTSPYLYLELFLSGGPQGGQIVNVIPFSGDQILSNIPTRKYVQNRFQYCFLPPDEWLVIRIPIETLNPDSLPITFIAIENHSDEAAQFFVDDIRLVGAGP